jgi:hypothetical protein
MYPKGVEVQVLSAAPTITRLRRATILNPYKQLGSLASVLPVF